MANGQQASRTDGGGDPHRAERNISSIIHPSALPSGVGVQFIATLSTGTCRAARSATRSGSSWCKPARSAPVAEPLADDPATLTTWLTGRAGCCAAHHLVPLAGRLSCGHSWPHARYAHVAGRGTAAATRPVVPYMSAGRAWRGAGNEAGRADPVIGTHGEPVKTRHRFLRALARPPADYRSRSQS